MWLAWLAHLGWRAWRRRQANAALLKGIAAGPSASDQEAKLLEKRFSDAVAKLKLATGNQSRGWMKSGSAGLYELPWYMFIGAPGSGKTTALMHAGLDFVLTDAESSNAEVQGVGGTRNCDWLFTRDAVLIDTAGRYTSQQSDQTVDAAAWDKFSGLVAPDAPPTADQRCDADCQCEGSAAAICG